MLSLLSLLAVGFFLGVRHATDADHVVAIATIVTRERRISAAAAIGVLWGVGHGLTILLVGCVIIVFGVVIPPRVGLAMEFAVGIMLTLLGVFTLAAVAKQAREALAVHLMHGHEGSPPLLAAAKHDPSEGHTHVHVHGDYVHTHAHGHEHAGHGHDEQATPQAWLDRHLGGMSLYQKLRPVVVGIVHGLAGSAAVGLLALAAVRDPAWGFVYLIVFGVGNIVGMIVITMVIAAPLSMSANRLPAISAGVRAFAGALSLGFGLLLMYEIGVVGGLFASTAP